MAKKPTKPIRKVKQTKPPSVLIATPMYGGMGSGPYLQSMLMLQSAFQHFGIPAGMCFMFNESLITRARNALVASFLKTEFTHLLFIDADIQFRAEDVIHALNADKDIIGGVYPKKEINWHSVMEAVQGNVPVDQLKHHTGAWVINLVDYKGSAVAPSDKPMEVWACGTGMMLIKRRVFEKLKSKVPVYLNDVGDTSGNLKDAEKIHEFFSTSIEPGVQRLLSEDYHFCRLWRMNGGKIYIAPWMQLGHVGTYIFDGRFPQTD
jgi:hypothetical protein